MNLYIKYFCKDVNVHHLQNANHDFKDLSNWLSFVLIFCFIVILSLFPFLCITIIEIKHIWKLLLLIQFTQSNSDIYHASEGRPFLFYTNKHMKQVHRENKSWPSLRTEVLRSRGLFIFKPNNDFSQISDWGRRRSKYLTAYPVRENTK